MANKTICQTPGTVFHTHISDQSLTCRVHLPFSLNLNEKDAELLETNLHNALELVLARYFPRD